MAKGSRGTGLDLERLIALYTLRCEVEGKSPRTIQAYRDTLQRFLRVARDEAFPKDVAAIAAAHLYSYLGRYTVCFLPTYQVQG